jgi:DNA-binding response OmpR family regulator
MAEAQPVTDRHILLVEDDGDLAEIVSRNLELSGYTVEVAADGAEGLGAARRHAPAMILLEVMMPVMDGWEVLRELKSEASTRDIPVVMLTALAEERDVIQGHLRGAVRYLTKPFQMPDLLRAVEDAIVPPEPQEIERRRATVRTLLQRLAEIDSGRTADSPVKLSRLESLPRRQRDVVVSGSERTRLEELTPKQREVAAALADGTSARELASILSVSRSNIYATRKRIARKLGVAPEEVADEARRLGLAEGTRA